MVFRKPIAALLRDLFRFKLNDGTDYIWKLCLSMIPVAVVGFFFKDEVEALFDGGLRTVAVCLLVTAALLAFSDLLGGKLPVRGNYRNGISWWQALLVGLGQACAVAPGLSRSGTTIATGLISGVKREGMAQFSFLMVLVPIIGEQMLDLLKGSSAAAGTGVGSLALLCGFAAAFISGLLACSAMVALVRRSRLYWFSIYCAVVAVLIFVLG